MAAATISQGSFSVSCWLAESCTTEASLKSCGLRDILPTCDLERQDDRPDLVRINLLQDWPRLVGAHRP